MLQVKSFKIEESDAMNEFLNEYRIAPEAHILVSNGWILIPYENGEPQNKNHRRIALQEQANQARAQLDIIEHSQSVLQRLRQDAVSRVQKLKEMAEDVEKNAKGKEKYDVLKERNEEVKRAENALKQIEDQYDQNAHEEKRLKVNMEMFEATARGFEA